ncbi:MAG: hypothetical protein NZ602_06550 [Thermoguttaceae bacterium]|nr:hypothetical protein [Thermoguttaceae bacterium]MDW8036941.1 hypothetical protein [Thermoguttaceae bacterium]
MPYSINGIGTTFYGHRDDEPDGSYVTTEWLIFLFIPILPIRSFRVWPLGQRRFLGDFSQQYLAREVPLCRPQVVNVYLTTFVLLSLLGLGVAIFLWGEAIWSLVVKIAVKILV